MNFSEAKDKVIEGLKEKINLFDCYSLMSYVPLTADECYFCVINDNECECCQYGQKYGECINDDDSVWARIYKKISKVACIYDENDDYCVNEREIEKIYENYISQISECKTVNGIMSLKRELISDCLVEIKKCFENDIEICEKLVNLIEYVDENYWINETEEKEMIKIKVCDISDSNLYDALIDAGYRNDSVLAEISEIIYKRGTKLKIEGEGDEVYIIAECEFDKYCLISMLDGNRWEDAVRIEDGIITHEILKEKLLGGGFNFEIVE